MATLSRLMKKAASSVISLANRTTPNRRNYTTAIFTTPLKISATDLLGKVFQGTSIPTHRHFSAIADKRSETDDILLGVTEPEIDDCHDKEPDDLEVVEAPREFPFKIHDNNPGTNFITLTRQYHDEEIEVEVNGPNYPNDSYDSYDSDDDDDDDDDEEEEDNKKREEESNPPNVYLNVSVSKKSGLTLKFSGWANAANGFRISTVKYPNDEYTGDEYNRTPIWDFGDKLQKTLHKYLEVRGFEPSIGNFLCDYMVEREHKKHTKKHTKWLNNLKDFINAN